MTTLLSRWLLDGVALWILVGLFGVAVSARRGERQRVRRGLITIVLVVVLYLGALLAVSLAQPTRLLVVGQSRCFDDVCFAVAGAQEIQGFEARGQQRDRLVQVNIAIRNRNRNHAAGESELSAYLLDADGHRWEVVPGLAGVALSVRVQAGGMTISAPVFRVANDATGLHLVLAHVGWHSGRLIIGDPESLLHRPTEMNLP